MVTRNVVGLHEPLGEYVSRFRAETAGCRSGTVHFNNAGASLMPDCVVKAVIDHILVERCRGGYESVDPDSRRVYRSLERLIDAERGSIACVENATRAWDLIFYSFTKHIGRPLCVLTTSSEYGSNVLPMIHSGAAVEVIPMDSHGCLDLSWLSVRLQAQELATVDLVSVSHIPSNGGLIHDAAGVGEICRSHGVPFLLDACQSVGQLPVSVKQIPCDALSATSRKYLRGPRGVGFLYVRPESVFAEMDPIFVDVRTAQWIDRRDMLLRKEPSALRWENWERSWANWYGLGAAVDYALEIGVENIAERVQFLAQFLRTSLVTLAQVSGVRRVIVQDPTDAPNLSGIVSFTVAGVNADSIHSALRSDGINVSVSYKSSTLFDMSDRQLEAVVRASVHYYNTTEEIKIFLQSLMRSLAH